MEMPVWLSAVMIVGFKQKALPFVFIAADENVLLLNAYCILCTVFKHTSMSVAF